MKNSKILAFFLLFTILSFGCKDDEPAENPRFFNCKIDGTDFVSTRTSYTEIFGIHTFVGTDDDDVEIQLLLSDNAEGTYEIGGGDKAYTASYDFSYSEQSGSVIITENNPDTKTITGTFDLVLYSALGNSTVNMTSGEFLVKY